MQHDTLTIDTVAWMVRVDGQSVKLTYLEFRLLLFLAEHPYKAFRREELIEAMQGPDSTLQLHMIDVYIHRLRRKLGSCGRFIRTVSRVGYSFDLRGVVAPADASSGQVDPERGGRVVGPAAMPPDEVTSS